MTQNTKRPPVKWLVAIPTDDKVTFGRNSLKAACRGNDKMGDLLNYFAFEASVYAEREKLKETKVVNLQLSHKTILDGINHAISEKTLIAYLIKLNKWELVGSQRYGKEYAVNIESINKAIANPPSVEIKKRGRPRQKKSCSNLEQENTSTLPENTTTSDPEKVELISKVVSLQEKVELLQLEVVSLQEKVVDLQLLKSPETAPDAALVALLNALDLETIKRLIETITPIIPKEVASSSDDLTHTLSQGKDEHRNNPTGDGSADSRSARPHPPERQSVVDTSQTTSYSRKPGAIRDKVSRKRAKPVSLTEITPLPPPEKPSPDELWNALTCLKLADYYRGYALTESERSNAPYQKAKNAAISAIQQGKTYEQIDSTYRYMKCVDPELKDDWWEGKPVELWHVVEHCTVKLREIDRKKLGTAILPFKPTEHKRAVSPNQGSAVISEEARQRNIARMRAEAAQQPPSMQVAVN